jgi:hypothetical protein
MPQIQKTGNSKQLANCPIPPALLESLMSTATARTLQKISDATSPTPLPPFQEQPLLKDLAKLKNAAAARRYKAENAKRKIPFKIAQAKTAELYAITVYSYVQELTSLLAGKQSDWVNNSAETKAYYDSRKKGGALENASKYLHTGLGTTVFVISAVDFVTPVAKFFQTLWVTHPQVMDKVTELADIAATIFDVLIKGAAYVFSAVVSIGIAYCVKLVVEKYKHGLDAKEQRDIEVDKKDAKAFGSALGKDLTERALVYCIQYGYFEQLNTIPEGKKYRGIVGNMDAVWKVYSDKLNETISSLPEHIRYLLHTPSPPNGKVLP